MQILGKAKGPLHPVFRDLELLIQILLIPAPPKRRSRDMRPLWRDLILMGKGEQVIERDDVGEPAGTLERLEEMVGVDK